LPAGGELVADGFGDMQHFELAWPEFLKPGDEEPAAAG
jgi:hypothetical protein